MKSARDLINARIAWCQRQREQAGTESEADGWRAEEHGLRDALLNKNYTDAYRLSTTKAFCRYVQGLREGRTILRVAQVDGIVSDIATGTPRPGGGVGREFLPGRGTMPRLQGTSAVNDDRYRGVGRFVVQYSSVTERREPPSWINRDQERRTNERRVP